MTLIRFEPMKEFEEMQNQIQDYINSFSNLKFAEGFSPVIDIIEEEKSIKIVAELPGVKKEDIKLTVEDNIITLEGEKRRNYDVDNTNFLRKERNCGKFKRKFTLPESIDNQKVEAIFTDGVLNIELGKLEAHAQIEKEIKVK